MEAVPEVVQRTEQEAQHEEGQQEQAHELFAQANAPVEEIQHAQDRHAQAAEDVRQPLHARDRRAGQKLREHLPGRREHSGQRLVFQQAPEAAGCGEVAVSALGDVHGKRPDLDAAGGIRPLHGQQHRQQQRRRHADAEHRAERDAHEALAEVPAALPVDEAIGKEKQRHEQAAHIADVIVAPDCQRQRQHIQAEAAVAQQHDRRGNQKRQQRKGIEPDDVPIIAARPRAQRVAQREDGHAQVASAEDRLQKIGKKQPGKGQLHDRHQREILAQDAQRHECREQIERACQIIGIERGIGRSHADVPAILHRAAGAQLLAEGHEKRIILMPFVAGHDLLIPEREEAGAGKDEAADEKRQQKCQRERPALRAAGTTQR